MEGELNLQLLLIYVFSAPCQSLWGGAVVLFCVCAGLAQRRPAQLLGCPAAWEQSPITGQVVFLRMKVCSGAKSVFLACIAPKASYLCEFVSLLQQLVMFRAHSVPWNCWLCRYLHAKRFVTKINRHKGLSGSGPSLNKGEAVLANTAIGCESCSWKT